MARPKKNNADYFSHDTDMRNNRRIRVVRERFGPIGYTMWCMLLEVLCDSDNFERKIDKREALLLAGDFGVSVDKFWEILECFFELGLVQRRWKLYWSDGLKRRMEPVMKKRERMREVRRGVRVCAAQTPQSKVKESKGKERKVKESKVVPLLGF